MGLLHVETSDGARLPVEVAGPDSPSATVVLAHGWTMTRASWRPVVERVRRQRPDVAVAVYDHRDHGDATSPPGRRSRATSQSGRYDRPMSMDVLAEDLLAVVEQAVPAGPVVLGGHSMGGMAVLALAENHPETVRDRVVGVTLVNTAGGGLDRRRLLGGLMSVLAALPSGVRVPRVPAPVARRVGYGRGGSRDLVTEVRRGVRAPTARSAGTWYTALIDYPGPTSLDALADVQVAVLAGGRDRLTPVHHSVLLAERLPGCRLDVLDDAGHMLPFEAPDLVAGAVVSMLPPAGCSGSRSADVLPNGDG